MTRSTFEMDVAVFNAMYQLSDFRTREESLARLDVFKKMLQEELEEIEELKQCSTPAEFLVGLADLLGDLQVYCASEMLRFGIPVNATLEIIMKSNFSKLDADGNPIYREDGKVMKGPNYWKPEPKIEEMLRIHKVIL